MKAGHYVSLTVEDSGKGMDEATRKRIFEPFFSTELEGRGLGMASVYGIVKNHNGFIFVDSKKSMGTVIRIYFPAESSSPALSHEPDEEANPES